MFHPRHKFGRTLLHYVLIFSIPFFSIVTATAPLLAGNDNQSDPAGPAWTVVGEPSDSIGEVLGPIGDLNGDGYADVAIFLFDEFKIYFGSEDGLALEPALTDADVPLTSSFFPKSVASAGDVNGDGYGDLILGDMFQDAEDVENVGAALLYYGSEDGLDRGQPWSALGETAEGQFGQVVASLGDVNGDGFADMAISAPGQYDGSAPGSVYIYYGSEDGIAESADLVWTGDEGIARFGEAVSGAGDINGDGYDDVLTSGGGAEEIYLYLGSEEGLPSTPSSALLPEAYDYIFGERLTGLGDVNGDGFADVLIDAEDIDDLVKGYIFYGSADGLSELPDHRIVLENPDGLETNYSAVGDLNGDGLDDMAISLTTYGFEENGSGTVYLYYGGEDGLPIEPSSTIVGAEDGDEFGLYLTGAGDVNGDGFGDILVGAPNSTEGGDYAGKAYLFQGSESGISVELTAASSSAASPEVVVQTVAEIASPEASSLFGYRATGVGDVNGDGYVDLLSTALYANDSQGAAYLYFGTEDGMTDEPAWTVTGEEGGVDFGYVAGGAGDLNNDGYADIYVSSPFFEQGRGKIYVFYGGPDGPADSPDWWFTGSNENSRAGLLASELGDIDGDGYDDFAITVRSAAESDEAESGEAETEDDSEADPEEEPQLYSQMGIFYGGEDGLGEDPGFVTSLESDLGSYIAPAGDVNGDGFADVILSPSISDEDAGTVFILHGSADGLDGTIVFEDTGVNVGDFYGWAARGLGDVNGDGYGDVLVTAPGVADAVGIVYLYMGSAEGLEALPQWEAPGVVEGSWFGSSIAALGDINGDGYADFAIGETENVDGPSHAYIYLGGADIASTTGLDAAAAHIHDVELLQIYDWDVRISPAGDVDGDGLDNYLITEPGYPEGAENGRVLVFGMNASSEPEVTPTNNSAPEPADYSWQPSNEQVLSGGEPGEAYGWQVVIVEDVNGDGYDELAVASVGNPDSGLSGRLTMHYGSSEGVNVEPQWQVGVDEWPHDQEEDAGIAAFMVASIGDVNGDGFGDIAGVVASEIDARFLGYYGSEDGLSQSHEWEVIPDRDAEEIAAARMVGLGDVNGDGFDDLGVLTMAFTGGEKGYFEVYLGSEDGLAEEPIFSRSIPIGEEFFMDIDTIGDVNDDGFNDLIIGLPNTEVGDVSQVNVLLGTENGVDLNQVWEADSELDDASLGIRVLGLGDVNGDGAPDFATTELGDSGASVQVYLNNDDLTQQTLESQAGQIIGIALAAIGDVNGDGYNDLMTASASEVDGSLHWHVFAGSSEGMSSQPIYGRQIDTSDPYFAFFQKLGRGDLNGDGYDDIALAEFDFGAIQGGDDVETSIVVLYGGETPAEPADDSSSSSSQSSDPARQSAIEFWESGTELLLEGKLEAALVLFDSAIETDPTFALAHNGRGRVFLGRELFTDSVEHFDAAIALDPELWQAYFNRGTANYKIDSFDEAIEDMSSVAELAPDVPDTYYWRGFSFLALDELESAVEDFTLLLELDPDHPQKDEVESVLAQLE